MPPAGSSSPVIVSEAGQPGPGAIEWRLSDTPVDYEQAVAEMDARSAAVRARSAPELVWLLEHPPLYTGGTSARATDLLTPDRFPVYRTGRGGQFTYHGPGQRIVYVVLDLQARNPDIRCYVHSLEAWIIRTLARFNVTGERRDGRVGIWVRRTDRNAPARDDKIAAIGVRIRRWVSLHGLSLNVAPDLEHYSGIVPCGVAEHGITSLKDLGLPVTMQEVDMALRAGFADVFGPGTLMQRRDSASGDG